MHNYSSRAVGVVGFRGYSGAELVGLLQRHRFATPTLLEHRADAAEGAVPLGSLAPRRAPATLAGIQSAQLDLVFLATPPEVSMELAPPMLEAGIRVIDLSGAFRLGDAETYTHWYHAPHTAPELIPQAVYGLPEFYRAAIPQARLIANPGCYPTAANLALRPLLHADAVDRAYGVVCDAKSGVSGAGRKPSLKTAFSEVFGNFSAYGFNNHRHVPEVLRTSGLNADQFTFTAQLLPLHRGILETIYLRTQGIESASDLLAIYQRQYAGERFVRLYEPDQLPDLRAVQSTNFCDIGFRFYRSTQKAMLVVVVDNLVKGAAGQALQNMNLMLGFEEAEGLL